MKFKYFWFSLCLVGCLYASETGSTDESSTYDVTESTLDMNSTTGLSSTSPVESTVSLVSLPSSTLSSTTLKSSTASETSSTDTPSALTESTVDMSMSSATGISSTSPLESTVSLPSSTLSSTTLKSSTASEISSTDTPSAITESTLDMSMSSATGISSTSPVESTVSLPSSTLSSTTLKSSITSEISTNYSSDTTSPTNVTETSTPVEVTTTEVLNTTKSTNSATTTSKVTENLNVTETSTPVEVTTTEVLNTTKSTNSATTTSKVTENLNVTETSTPVEVTTTEVLNTTKSTNSATTTSKVISTTEVEVSTECFLATPPYPPACPEGFSGSAYWECECNSPECTLVLLNCNNIWLDSVNCEVGIQALVDFATNLQDGLFLQHEVEKILDKLLICFNMTLNEDEDDGMLTESALSSVEYILTKSNQSISEEERLRNLVTSTTAIKSMGDQLLETSGMQGQPIFSQSSSGKVNLGVTRSNSEVNFGFNSVNVTIPNGKKIKDIIAFEIEEEGVAPGTLSSFGESGKTNSPILGVSLTDTETRIQILADSQLNENEEIQMIFKNFLPVDGPFESIRRDLFPGESQTIRQGSMECSFLAESPSLFPYWSSYGCEVVESTTEYTQCKCNHPGTFAAIGENQNYLVRIFLLC
ncbi:serine-rich adhesin for platelets-like [Artemia franciscana]|uniref:serine-rich adhesin for platelets-like n=1 Tax=Artemia franciscana TaxID=6661 RepID=UPI0032DA9FD9